MLDARARWHQPSGPLPLRGAPRTVLNPQRLLFREARYLLAEESAIRDPALYHSVLAAIAGGHHTNGGIASFIGRKSDQITHPLNVLVVGPHFEELCRAFALESGDRLFDEQPSEVGSSTVNGPVNRTQIEIDVVAIAAFPVDGRHARVTYTLVPIPLIEASWPIDAGSRTRRGYRGQNGLL